MASSPPCEVLVPLRPRAAAHSAISQQTRIMVQATRPGRFCVWCLLLLLAGAYRRHPYPEQCARVRTVSPPFATLFESSCLLLSQQDGLERRSLQTYSQLVQRCGSGGEGSADKQTIMLIDGDNVRGKTKFRLSKQQLCDAVDKIVRAANLKRVCLYFDHSTKQTGYVMPDNPNGFAVIFSGPRNSVDNVIVRDIKYFQTNQSSDVLVVTEDRNLKKRCRRTSLSNNKYKAKKVLLRAKRDRAAVAASHMDSEDRDVDEHTLGAAVPVPTTAAAGAGSGLKDLHIMDSPQFADMVMDFFYKNCSANTMEPVPLPAQLSPKLSAWLANREFASKADARRHRSRSSAVASAMTVPTEVGKKALLRKEVEVRKKMDKLRLLEGRGNRGNDIKNSAKIENLSHSLATIQRLIAESYSGSDGGSGSDSSSNSSIDSSRDTPPPSPDSLVLMKLQEIAQNRLKLLAEETWERVVLAEQFRYELEEAQRARRGAPFSASDSTRALGRYVSYLNDMAFNKIEYNL